MGCIYLNIYSKGVRIYYRFMFLYRGCIFYAYNVNCHTVYKKTDVHLVYRLEMDKSIQ